MGMSLKDYQKLTGTKHKYGNEPTMYDDILFDSRKEANRYAELRLLEKAGAISDLRRQVTYELQPGFRWKDKKIRPIHYIADFVYKDCDGTEVIEDVKSDGTRKDKAYQLKKKMMLYKFQIDIKET